MKHAVVDLETRDTKPTAKIISIGIAVIEDSIPVHRSSALVETYYQELWWELQADRTESEETAEWWDNQSKLAKNALYGKYPLRNALTDIACLVRKVDRIWGNGPIFDLGILEDAYRQLNLDIPWPHWNTRCYKTALEIAKVDRKSISFDGIKHNALDDAIHEAKILHLALRKTK